MRTGSFDTVIHLAAVLNTASRQQPDEALRVSIGSSLTLLRLAARSGCSPLEGVIEASEEKHAPVIVDIYPDAFSRESNLIANAKINFLSFPIQYVQNFRNGPA